MISRSDRDPLRAVDNLLSVLIYVFGIYLFAILLYYAWTLRMERVRFINFFFGPGLALFYLHRYKRARMEEESAIDEVQPDFVSGLRDRFSSVYDLVGGDRLVAILYPLLAAIALACFVYVELNFTRLQYDAPVLGRTGVDYLVGAVLILLSIHATKVAYGWSITLVTVFALLYAILGPLLPGFLGHSGMSISRVTVVGAIGLDGVYGFIMGIGATWVAVFIMFAGMAKTFGLLDYVLDLGREMSNFFRSGVVQMAVISSLFIGSITGSAAANTATTGSFTIPIMKQQGVDSEYAAAIEGVASSGSQLMPPVMGVAAFLMADILGVPYPDVLRASFLPAVLFYAAIALSIQFLVMRMDWTVAKTNQFDRSVIPAGLHFVAPFAVLLYTLVVMRLTPLSAGLYTIVALVATHAVRNFFVDGIDLGTTLQTGKDVLNGAKDGAVEMAPLIGVLAALGVIVEMVTQTGLSQKLSTQIVGLAGGVFLLLLVLAMITSILFGLGMPTPAAYILVVILVAPALINAGVGDLVAHMFVFYFAVLSAITPPVAISVIIGSQIAGVGFLPAAKQALRIGAPVFILPFGFISNEALIYWSLPETVYMFLFVLVGLALLNIALIGYDGARNISLPKRGGYFVLGLVALFGPLTIQAGVFALGAFLLLDKRFRFIRTVSMRFMT